MITWQIAQDNSGTTIYVWILNGYAKKCSKSANFEIFGLNFFTCSIDLGNKYKSQPLRIYSSITLKCVELVVWIWCRRFFWKFANLLEKISHGLNSYASVYLKITHKNGQKNMLVIVIYKNIGNGTNNVYQSYGYSRTIHRGST
jgi:hypothetical protein